MSKPLLRVLDLSVAFPASGVRAARDVSLEVDAGRSLVLLGESGCGKSITLRAIMGLLPRSKAVVTGSVLVDGREMVGLPETQSARLRGPLVSMVFQEPALAFDPVFRIGDQIVEMVRRHEPGTTDRDARRRALDLFELVRIPSPERRLASFPHELSGGMRQRAMLALALSCRPKLLLADEPTTALDATVQIQVLLLLRDIQRELGMGVVMVTHDLGVAAEVADHVAVMYAGRIVESGSAVQVLTEARHPYTRALISSTVFGAERGRPLPAIGGAPPSLAELPPGCSFGPRCPHVFGRCQRDYPAAFGEPEHLAECWLLDHTSSPDGAVQPARPTA